MRSPRSKHLDRTARGSCRCAPGIPERATHEGKRHGTSSLYAALDLTTGKVIGRLVSSHRAIEFKKFPQTLEQEEVPARSCSAPGPRQRLDAQDTDDQALAARAPPVRPAFHPDQDTRPAEPRRALVRPSFTTKKLKRSPLAPSPRSTKTSEHGSRPGTTNPNPTSGPRPLTKSSSP